MVQKYLASVSLTTIRRHDRKCFQYMDVYRKIRTRKAANYAVEMYRSHRKVQIQFQGTWTILLLPIVVLCNGFGKTRWILMDFDGFR